MNLMILLEWLIECLVSLTSVQLAFKGYTLFMFKLRTEYLIRAPKHQLIVSVINYN